MSAPAVRFDAQTLVKLNAQRVLRAARLVNIAAARADGATFCRFVLRDEAGKRIEMAPMHTRWHDILDRHDRVVMWSHVEAGKTNQISVGRSLFRLGRDPNRRVVVVSKTNKLATNITRLAAQYIEQSDDLRAVFPDLRPSDDRSMPWTSTSFTVQRTGFAKEPSFQAVSVQGTIVGARIDTLILDDIVDYDNTSTEYQRDQMWHWLQGQLIGRLTAQSEVWALGNALHPRDALHRLAALPRYKSYRFPVIDPVTGQSSWPKVWPMERIEARRLEFTPAEFGRQMLCQALDTGAGRFEAGWVDKALELGDGFELVDEVPEEERRSLLADGYVIVHGVDLASSKSKTADITCIFTILVWPNGKYQVLRVHAGKWHGPEIIRELDATYKAFGGTFVVENNAAQAYILQFAQELTFADLVPFRTGNNKVNPQFGVESLGADMNAGRWVVPNSGGRRAPAVDAWLRELLFYDPTKHTGDRMMASWFAREYARGLLRDRVQRGTSDGLGARVIG